VVLTITNPPGRALTLSDIKVIADTSTGTMENILGTGTLAGGQSTSFTYNYGVACEGNSITVQLILLPDNIMTYYSSGTFVGPA